jgi:L-ribulose-5-phosphate 3-epimerase
MSNLSRRSLLKTAATVPVAAWTGALRSPSRLKNVADGPRKAVLVSMLPKELSWNDRFALAREIGFEGVEMHTMPDQAMAEEVAKASADTGLIVHSVMNSDHWRYPLSSADTEVVKKSVAGMKTSLQNASLWKAGAVLLVPAVVTPETSYADAWKRSQRVIRDELLPDAEQAGVVIAVEEVWNKFLLSPLEFAQYVDEFESPYVKAYFDVGNIVFYGYPQDWIRTLGERIVRVHLKDFKLDRREGKFDWVNIGEGDIDWQATRQALADIEYKGWMTTEISGGDRAYLTNVVSRLDRFLDGQKPLA